MNNKASEFHSSERYKNEIYQGNIVKDAIKAEAFGLIFLAIILFICSILF